jgi:hypothetical protein
MQKSITKKTTPLCLDNKDSVKNKLIVTTAKEMCTKFFVFIALIKFKDTNDSNNNKPNIPVSAKI